MNDKSTGVVEVSLPASEFVDRFLISVLKLNKLKQGEKQDNQELQRWIDTYQAEFDHIMSLSVKTKQASEDLAHVHTRLWDLEDLIRSPQADDASYFAKTAKQIFALNTVRHKLKQTIDSEFPSMSFGPRLYEKGTD